MILSFIYLSLWLITAASGHGVIISPAARRPGTAFKNACGDGISRVATSGWDGSVQEFLGKKDSGFKEQACNIFLCKGAKFLDNTANVQEYSPGQKVQIKVDITVPHVGPANVSVLATASNTVIGTPLISFVNYTTPADNIPKSQTDFVVTIPTNLGNRCNVAGDCVLQWWWDGEGINQTYMDCIDFTTNTLLANPQANAVNQPNQQAVNPNQQAVNPNQQAVNQPQPNLFPNPNNGNVLQPNNGNVLQPNNGNVLQPNTNPNVINPNVNNPNVINPNINNPNVINPNVNNPNVVNPGPNLFPSYGGVGVPTAQSTGLGSAVAFASNDASSVGRPLMGLTAAVAITFMAVLA